MSTEANKALVRRAYLDGMNTRNMDIIEEVFSTEYLSHFPGQPPTRGIEPIKAVLQSFFDAFPDIVFTVEDQMAEDDKVMTRWTARGTHTGEWRGFPPRDPGIPPTGRHIFIGATDVYLISDGQVVEEWNTLEPLAVLEQIGAVPKPEQIPVTGP